MSLRDFEDVLYAAVSLLLAGVLVGAMNVYLYIQRH